MRWTASLLAAECLLCLFQLGTAAFSGKKGLHDVSGLLLMLPLAFLSAQLPLWGMRFGWRYRIVAPGDHLLSPLRFSLQQIFFATTAIALVLACMRGGSMKINADARDMLISALGGTLVILPCVLIVFRTRSVSAASFFAGSYVALLCIAIPLGALGMGSGDIEDVALSSSVFFASGVFVLCGSLLILRMHGYSLRRIRTEPRGDQA